MGLPSARADPVTDCNQDKDRERCIRGCTAYIESNRDPEGLANAYHNRAVARMQEGDVDRAIADYDKVVAIMPHYADVYYNRGIAYGIKGDISRAISDYGTTLPRSRSNPTTRASTPSAGLPTPAAANLPTLWRTRPRPPRWP